MSRYLRQRYGSTGWCHNSNLLYLNRGASARHLAVVVVVVVVDVAVAHFVTANRSTSAIGPIIIYCERGWNLPKEKGKGAGLLGTEGGGGEGLLPTGRHPLVKRGRVDGGIRVRGFAYADHPGRRYRAGAGGGRTDRCA